ncbi:MAG: hypothetical protein GXO86_01820, partial [Chlorobi bacterium]|nr:hypothetical protein [Chlorobiota bacterium]
MHHRYSQKPLLVKIVLILSFVLFYFMAPAQQKSATYEEAIKKADSYLQQNQLLNAKAYYQMALKLKPEDAYAVKQIRAVVDKLKASQAKEEKYYDIIDLADVFFDEGAYNKALAQYRKALGVIPGDAYAQDQIAKIQRKRAE